MGNFSKRLVKAMDERHITAAELSRKLGVHEGTISNYKNGKYEPKQRRLDEMSQILNVSIPWLMGADVPMSRRDEYFCEPSITENVVSFPVIGTVAAGYDEIAIEDWTGDTVEIPLSYIKGRSSSDFFVLSVHGDSMYPLYMNGDKVLILKKSSLNKSGDIGVIMYDNECATLKKIEYTTNGDWLKLVPLNPEYQPKLLTGVQLEECRIIGIPFLLIRNLHK